tara:strand:- start:1085 stop:1510 length:426 start_codon:yes stop_codon:yes gene_type:complete
LNKDSLKSVVKKSIAPQIILGKKLKKKQIEQEKKIKKIEKKFTLFEKTVMKIKDQVNQYAELLKDDLYLKEISKQFNGLKTIEQLKDLQNEINSIKEDIGGMKDSISIKLDDHQKTVNTFYSRLDDLNFQNYRPARLKRIY